MTRPQFLQRIGRGSLLRFIVRDITCVVIDATFAVACGVGGAYLLIKFIDFSTLR